MRPGHPGSQDALPVQGLPNCASSLDFQGDTPPGSRGNVVMPGCRPAGRAPARNNSLPPPGRGSLQLGYSVLCRATAPHQLGAQSRGAAVHGYLLLHPANALTIVVTVVGAAGRRYEGFGCLKSFPVGTLSQLNWKSACVEACAARGACWTRQAVRAARHTSTSNSVVASLHHYVLHNHTHTHASL